MLTDMGLFEGLDSALLETLASELKVSQWEPGQTVVKEGDVASEMFVIVGGELEVLKHASGGADVRVALFGPGGWFGEMAVLDVQPRSATVRAVAPTTLVHLGPNDVERLLRRGDPQAYIVFLSNVARELSRRLRVADGILAHFVAGVHQYVGARR